MKHVLWPSLILALACGGAAEVAAPDPTPPVPVQPEPEPVVTGGPALVHPVEAMGRCKVALPDGTTIADFEGACARWSLSVNPTDAADILVRMDDRPPQRSGRALPAFPASTEGSSVDAIGFGPTGQVTALLERQVDPTLDEEAQKAWIEVEGMKLDLDYEMASMFGVVLCETWTLEGETWTRVGTPRSQQLFEGMYPPWCADGGPELVLHHAGEGVVRTETGWTAPEALAAIPLDELGSWYKLTGADLAVAGFWFEGLLFQTPAASFREGTWTVLEGLEAKGDPLTLERRGDLLLACTPTASLIYDVAKGFQVTWKAGAPCPLLWPPE